MEERTEQLSDSVLRAMTNDGAFRVITTRTTDMVQEAIRAQRASGETARRFADLLTGAVLVRETMAPQLRVQGLLQGADGSGSVIADSHPEGWSRGLVHLKEGKREIAFGEGALLQMMRTLPNGDLHKGVVEVPRKGGISTALMSYMRNSEQVASMIAVGCVLEGGDNVRAAGGYIVQLLPEVGRGPLAIMTERLKDFESIDHILAELDASPQRLIDELLYGMPFTRLDESTLRFDCNCSPVRVISSLAVIARSDIEEFVEAGEPLELTCDYCGKSYMVQPEQLRGLLEAS